MKPYWEKSVYITASRSESGCVDFKIEMGLTGPMLVMSINGEGIVIASRWTDYTTEHGNKELIAAIKEGVQALKDLKL